MRRRTTRAAEPSVADRRSNSFAGTGRWPMVSNKYPQIQIHVPTIPSQSSAKQ